MLFNDNFFDFSEFTGNVFLDKMKKSNIGNCQSYKALAKRASLKKTSVFKKIDFDE